MCIEVNVFSCIQISPTYQGQTYSLSIHEAIQEHEFYFNLKFDFIALFIVFNKNEVAFLKLHFYYKANHVFC